MPAQTEHVGVLLAKLAKMPLSGTEPVFRIGGAGVVAFSAAPL